MFVDAITSLIVAILLQADGSTSQPPGLPHGSGAEEAAASAFEPSLIDVRSFGAKGDGVSDDTVAIEAAIRSAGPSRRFSPPPVLRPDGARIIYFPTPPAFYRITRRIDLPPDRNLRLLGDSSHSARISLDSATEHYIFRVLSGDGQRPTIFEKLVFHRGGIEYEGGLRRMQAIRDCAFVGAPDWAVRTLGQSVIAMEISRSQFTEGRGGINVAFAQSDLWVISHCDFVRNSGVDLRIATSGVHVRDCDFEVKPDPAQPFVQLVSAPSGNRPGSDVVFQNVRFGNEAPSAPRDVVVIGPLEGTALATTGAIWFRDCLWRGAHRQAPSESNGWSAIRLTQPTTGLNISGSSFWAYRYIVDEAFARGGPASAPMPSQNVFSDNSLMHWVSESRLFSAGGLGWSVRGAASALLDPGRTRAARTGSEGLHSSNLLPDTELLDLSKKWSRTNVVVSRDSSSGAGPGGSSFRLVASDQGLPQLATTALAPVMAPTATFSIWLRSEERWNVALAVAGRGGAWRTSPRELATVDSSWRRYSVTAHALDTTELLSVYVLPVRPPGSDVPIIHVALPQLERGTAPTDYIPNLERDQIHAPRGFQAVGLGLLTIEAGDGPPAAGQYSLGDKVLNSRPTELGPGGSRYVIDGWRCVKAGSPGVWVELRSPTGN